MYPIKVRGGHNLDRALALLKETGMEDFADRYPGQVSGGQKRRAAIARALAAEPKVLLLDEPFVHLDRVVRGKLITDLTRLVADRQIPTLLVTHDLDIAAQMADEISIMEDGVVVQAGSKQEVLFEPASSGVARLFGNANILRGRVNGVAGGLWHTETDGILWKVPFIGDLEIGQKIEVVIRSGAVKILKPNLPVPEALALNAKSVRVKKIDRRPETVIAAFVLSNQVVLTGSFPTDVFDRAGLRVGDDCEIAVTLEGIRLFPEHSQQRDQFCP
jgi:ABC-type sulfate/molybdate transport systems ATPase subunit